MYTQKTKILYRELPEDKPGYRTFLTDKKIYRIHHLASYLLMQIEMLFSGKVIIT